MMDDLWLRKAHLIACWDNAELWLATGLNRIIVVTGIQIEAEYADPTSQDRALDLLERQQSLCPFPAWTWMEVGEKGRRSGNEADPSPPPPIAN